MDGIKKRPLTLMARITEGADSMVRGRYSKRPKERSRASSFSPLSRSQFHKHGSGGGRH